MDTPDWSEAPSWAVALGIADFDCDYRGEWCWLADTASLYFTNIEQRPKTECSYTN